MQTSLPPTLRLMKALSDRPVTPKVLKSKNHIGFLATCMKSILSERGFSANGTTLLDALDQFESVYYHEIFKDDRELHDLFFKVSEYILMDQFVLDELRFRCHERIMNTVKRHEASTSLSGEAVDGLSQREILERVLRNLGVELSAETVLALAKKEYRRQCSGIKMGRPESYTIDQLKEMALLPGHQNKMKRSNARQALRKRGVPPAEIPTFVTEYRPVTGANR